MNRICFVNIIQKMPLNTNETKALLLNIFRLTLAASERRTDEAAHTFGLILDTIILPNLNDAIGDISSIHHVGDEINLVIQEVPESNENVVGASGTDNPSRPNIVSTNQCVNNNSDEESDVEEESAEEETVDEETVVEESVEEESVEEESVEEAVEEEEVKEKAVEEKTVEEKTVEEELEEESAVEEESVVELNLDPVRIKKVLYYMDRDNGDLYTYLPDDEVGDKIGSYIDGKPVFD